MEEQFNTSGPDCSKNEDDVTRAAQQGRGTRVVVGGEGSRADGKGLASGS